MLDIHIDQFHKVTFDLPDDAIILHTLTDKTRICLSNGDLRRLYDALKQVYEGE